MKTSKKDKISKILVKKTRPGDLNFAVQPKKSIVKIKDFFKQNQLIYSLAMSLAFPIRYNFYYSRIIFEYLSKDSVILNLGSGNKVVDKSIINVDLFRYENVDIHGNIENLPIKDGCVDGIINEVTLEHLNEPEKAISEMNRILKNGGYLCLSVPFLYPFHESPGDYCRWTKNGAKLLLENNGFKVLKIENLGGPVGAFVLITTQLLAIIFSFNIMAIYHFFSYLLLLMLSPLYLLDFIFSRYSMAGNASSIFLIVAKKNTR